MEFMKDLVQGGCFKVCNYEKVRGGLSSHPRLHTSQIKTVVVSRVHNNNKSILLSCTLGGMYLFRFPDCNNISNQPVAKEKVR